MSGIPFEFDIPVSVWEKAGAPKGKERRIGGIISTESRDQQGETVLQQGLDFSPFLKGGWFNDNHSKKTTDIVGYPESVRRFRKGARLPDGTAAATNGTWAEGYLLKNKAGQEIWDTAQALKDTGRRLGFSVEGAVTKRIGQLRKTIARARVRNVAITNCPVNEDSRLEVLAKSLQAVAAVDDFDLEKALQMGPSTPDRPPVDTPTTGGEGGRILANQSLERGAKTTTYSAADILGGEPEDEKKRKKRKVKKSLTATEAVRHVKRRLPGASTMQAIRLVRLTQALKRTGAI